MPHLPGPRALVPEDTQLLGEKIAWRPDWCSHPIAPGNRHSAVWDSPRVLDTEP